jgi:hypothetical protein
MHSDNALEKIKAENHIKALYEKLNTAKLHKALANNFNLRCYHGPEHSPQYNGLIERIVQTIKRPLYKILNGKIMTETEFYTILTDCESATNMRPLSSISENSDDNNILPITPSHLILGKALTPLPTDINSYEAIYTTKKTKQQWEERKQLAHQFWNLWKNEYLLSLRELTKNYVQQRNLKGGDVVLMIKERITKLHWPLAIVQEVCMGRDGNVRSVWLRLPIPANKITKEGKYLTQHKYVRRGIEQHSLLDAAFEETSPNENARILQNPNNNHSDTSQRQSEHYKNNKNNK